MDTFESDLRGLDLNLLVVLESLRHTGSVTRAAERLGITQSGASRALARLRRALDDPLFVSVGTQLTPTPRCEALAADLAGCLDAARRVLRSPDFEPHRATGAVHLGMPDHLAYLHGPALLQRIRAEAPALELVVRGFSRDWLRDLREGTVDLAFGVVHGDESDVRARWLTDDPWAVLLRRGHPALKRAWDARSFAAGEHALMTVTGGGPGPVDLALAAQGLERRIVYRATSPLVVALAAAESDLRVTTSVRLAKALAKRLPLVVRPLPVEAEPLRLPLVWHDRVHHDAQHRWLRALVADTVA